MGRLSFPYENEEFCSNSYGDCDGDFLKGLNGLGLRVSGGLYGTCDVEFAGIFRLFPHRIYDVKNFCALNYCFCDVKISLKF